MSAAPAFEVIGAPLSSIFLFRPLTDEARDWCDDNVDPDHTVLGDAIAVEHRFITGLVGAARHDGFAVHFN